MPTDNDKTISTLTTALRKEIARSAILASPGRDHAEVLGEILAARLDIVVDGDRMKVSVLDREGRARTRVDHAGRFSAVTVDDAVAEMSTHPRLSSLFDPKADAATPQSGTGTQTLDELRAEHRDRQHREVRERISRASSQNPWNRATFNLTDQMFVQRHDPRLAESLKATAAEAA